MVRLRVILWHTEAPSTVASFRTWRGLKVSVAQSPKPDNGSADSLMVTPADTADNEEAQSDAQTGWTVRRQLAQRRVIAGSGEEPETRNSFWKAELDLDFSPFPIRIAVSRRIAQHVDVAHLAADLQRGRC
jgi:hypothetical protein